MASTGFVLASCPHPPPHNIHNTHSHKYNSELVYQFIRSTPPLKCTELSHLQAENCSKTSLIISSLDRWLAEIKLVVFPLGESFNYVKKAHESVLSHWMQVSVIGVVCKWFFQATDVFWMPAKCLVAPSPSGGLVELNGLRKPVRVTARPAEGAACARHRDLGKHKRFLLELLELGKGWCSGRAEWARAVSRSHLPKPPGVFLRHCFFCFFF